MKALLAVLTSVLVLAPLLTAAPSDEAIVAATRVGELSNYSWTCTTSSEETGATSIIEGRTIKGGYTKLTDRNPSAFLQVTAGRDIEGAVVAYFLGSDQCVIQTNSGWKQPFELEIPTGRARRNSGYGNQASEVTFAIRHPAEDLEIIIGSYTSLRASGDTFVGELNEGGAMQFLSAFGQPRATVQRASARYQCWVEGGMVVKYEVDVSGTVSFGNGRNTIPVHWTITTDIHDAGKTVITIPPEVRGLLG